MYRKSLLLSASSRQQRTLGQLVNLMQVDTQKLDMLVNSFHNLWDGLFQICGYMAVLVYYIGPSAFVGMVVMILAMPVQMKIMKAIFGLS